MVYKRDISVASVLFLALSIFSVIFAPIAQAASFPAANKGYFDDRKNLNPAAASHVLADPYNDGQADSIPSYINSKETFVNFIEAIYRQQRYAGRAPINTAHNRIGAAFIIQTMRSDGTNYDRSLPTDAQVADWRQKVLNYSGTISWNVPTAGLITNSSPNSYYQNSDIGWHNSAGSPSPNGLIIFYDTSGNIDYMIKRNCANPIGKLDGIQSSNWSISASSSSNISTAKPGDTIQWTHTLTNDGPTATSTNVHSNLGLSGFSNGWGNPSVEYSAGDNGAGTAKGVMRTLTNYATYTVTQDDVGHSLCEMVRFDPQGSSGARNGAGNTVCVSVPYNYTLTPGVTIPQTEVEVGNTITVQAGVQNSGPTKSKPTDWQLSYITAPSGVGIPTAADNSSLPCDYYQGGGRVCTIGTFTSGGAGTGTGDVFSPPSYNFASRQAVTADLPVGTQICYALSIRDRSSGSGQWAHSTPQCVVVSKRPVVRITGSDLIVGRGLSIGSIVNTNVKTVSGTRYGAWTEYGVEASGLVSGMASASGYAGGVTTTNLCGVSYLTFSNKVGTSSCSDAKIGQYTFKASVSTIAGRFPAAAGTQIAGAQDIDSLASGKTYTNNTAGNEILLTSAVNATVPAGKWVVINAPNATVKIMNNIVYTNDALTSVAQIPQVIIIAKNIIIADSVSQVDAWLMATGTGAEGRLNTCGAGDHVDETTQLTSAICTTKLTVNGPVAANHLLLRRTAGAGTNANSGDPAEVFNLRPDAYMWASNLQASTSKAQTVRTTELPPRY